MASNIRLIDLNYQIQISRSARLSLTLSDLKERRFLRSLETLKGAVKSPLPVQIH